MLLRFVRARCEADRGCQRFRSDRSGIFPIDSAKCRQGRARIGARSGHFPEVPASARRRQGGFGRPRAMRRQLHRAIECPQHHFPAVPIPPAAWVTPKLLKRRPARLQPARLRCFCRNRAGGTREKGENGDREEPPHARKLARRIDPSIFAPTPPYAHRYRRRFAAANRHRDSRSASRHRRRRADSRATDHTRTAAMPRSSSALTASPARRSADRAARIPNPATRP